MPVLWVLPARSKHGQRAKIETAETFVTGQSAFSVSSRRPASDVNVLPLPLQAQPVTPARSASYHQLLEIKWVRRWWCEERQSTECGCQRLMDGRMEVCRVNEYLFLLTKLISQVAWENRSFVSSIQWITKKKKKEIKQTNPRKKKPKQPHIDIIGSGNAFSYLGSHFFRLLLRLALVCARRAHFTIRVSTLSKPAQPVCWTMGNTPLQILPEIW